MTTLVVDGDIVAYKASAAAETPIKWGEDLWTLHAFESEVSAYIDNELDKLQEEAECDELIVALSSTTNYRKKVCDTYKLNRTKVRKPMLLPYAKEYILDKYTGMVWKNIEADDLLGILCTTSFDYVIWSIDKDLMTVPGRHLVDGRIIEVSEQEADYAFLKQVLTGDITDNYGGCPKVGEKTAEKILEKECSWDAVVSAYAKAGLSEEVALQQARLARILRNGEYDVLTHEVKLWNP